MQYQSIDHAVQQLQQLDQGCFLSKTDIAHAFRIVPLHPSQYCLSDFVWREQFCYYRWLPVGCSASCKIFETLSNALQWMASSKLHIRNTSHVLDDFLLLARDKAVGQAQLSAFLSMCADIGIPSAPDKTVQPTSASQSPQTKPYSRHRHPNCPRQNRTADIGIPIAPDKTVQPTSASQLPQTKPYSRHRHPKCPRQNCTADIGIPVAPDKTVQPTSASQLPQTKLYSRHRLPLSLV